MHAALVLAVAALMSGPGEARDMARLAWVESRGDALAQGTKDDCGLFQVRARFLRDELAEAIAGDDQVLRRRITCARLKADPLFAARTGLEALRDARRHCGRTWSDMRVCYRCGPSGAATAKLNPKVGSSPKVGSKVGSLIAKVGSTQ